MAKDVQCVIFLLTGLIKGDVMKNKNMIVPYRNFTIDKKDRFRHYGVQLFFFCFNVVALLFLLCGIVTGLMENMYIYAPLIALMPMVFLLIVIFLVCIFLKNRVFNLIIAMLFAIAATITMAFFVLLLVRAGDGIFSLYIAALENDYSQTILNSLPVLLILFSWVYSFLAVKACLRSHIVDVTYTEGITIESPTYEDFAEFFKNFYKPTVLNGKVSDEDRIWLRNVDWVRGLSILSVGEKVRGYSFVDYKKKTILYVGVIGDDKWNRFYEDILVQDSLRRLTDKWVFSDQKLNSITYKDVIQVIQEYGWSIIHKDSKTTTLTFTPSAVDVPF